MRKLALTAAAVLIGAALAWTTGASGQTTRKVISGAGTSMLAGGTGAPSFTPVVTKFAFTWDGRSGRFECLALAPASPTSGSFDQNAMYVTGRITSAKVSGDKATLKGTSTVTGLGAGSDRPFTFTVSRGGPGATLDLDVSDMTFNEIVLSGKITF